MCVHVCKFRGISTHNTHVRMDHVPHSVEYVISRMCHACNMIFYACMEYHVTCVAYTRRDIFHATWMWSMQTRVVASHKYMRVKMKL